MKSLDDALDTLTKLNDYRRQAQRLRDGGFRALERIATQASAEQVGWRTCGDNVETALVILVRSRNGARGLASGKAVKLVERLRRLKLRDLFLGTPEVSAAKGDLQQVPVLLAARAMQALIATSSFAFSKTTLLCYYRVLREIYSADSPDWSTGGAKAGGGGESTAFITAECIRAVSALARTHEQTSAFFGRTYDMYKRREELRRLEGIGKWSEAELERVGLAWFTATNVQIGEIALNMPERKAPPDRINNRYVSKYLRDLPGALNKSIEAARKNFVAASEEIKRYRKEEERASKEKARGAKAKRRKQDQRFLRTESAHLMALSAVEQAIDRAAEAFNICPDNETTLENLRDLSELFADISRDIYKILEPAKRFLGAVLDRELTAASASQAAWDARELAFAAASYGAVTNWKSDERLTRTCRLLCEIISEHGTFAAGRPFHSTANGYSLYASVFEVARVFAQLLQHVEFPVEPQLVGRMLRLFEDNKLPPRAEGATDEVGWHAEDPPIPRKPTLWVTALAVLGLERILRMLDHKINEGVLEHFSCVRYDKGETGLSLEQLVFPDYALHSLPPALNNELPPEQRRSWSVAITLEQMRAHVLHTNLPAKYKPTKFSAVLFGPPGTGKTTLLEALARSCRLPLVQVTPSDIAVAGEEAIEKRAKIIFDALSMLTRAVIIFDEFEPILLSRETNGEKEERNIFTFLTPGMLPKLKKLYEAAARQRVAYCLVTNHYEKLDEAAIRRGRFDEHIAIYHPDFLSRAGTFLDGLYKHGGIKELTAEQRARFENVVKWTSGSNINDLVKDLLKVPKDLRDLPEGQEPEHKSFAAYVLFKSVKMSADGVKSSASPAGVREDGGRLESWLTELERELTYGPLNEVLKKIP